MALPSLSRKSASDQNGWGHRRRHSRAWNRHFLQSFNHWRHSGNGLECLTVECSSGMDCLPLSRESHGAFPSFWAAWSIRPVHKFFFFFYKKRIELREKQKPDPGKRNNPRHCTIPAIHLHCRHDAASLLANRWQLLPSAPTAARWRTQEKTQKIDTWSAQENRKHSSYIIKTKTKKNPDSSFQTREE